MVINCEFKTGMENLWNIYPAKVKTHMVTELIHAEYMYIIAIHAHFPVLYAILFLWGLMFIFADQQPSPIQHMCYDFWWVYSFVDLQLQAIVLHVSFDFCGRNFRGWKMWIRSRFRQCIDQIIDRKLLKWLLTWNRKTPVISVIVWSMYKMMNLDKVSF